MKHQPRTQGQPTTALHPAASPSRLLVIVTVSVFIAELLVMILLTLLPPPPRYLTAIVDASLLTLVVIPTLYLYLLRPMSLEITERKQAERALQRSHDEMEQRVHDRTLALTRANEALQAEIAERQQREQEIAALLAGSRAVLANNDFEKTAKELFEICKGVLGATAGYVSLINERNEHNKPIFHDTGGQECAVTSTIQMRIRGFREQAYATGKTVVCNDFPNSDSNALLPRGHVRLDNVLFAPVTIHGKAVGLLGLANKPGGFTNNDGRVASAFGELAAISLLNSQTLKSLKDVAAEAKTRADVLDAVFAAITDAVVVYDASGSPLRANPAAVAMLGTAPRRLSRAQFLTQVTLRYPGGQAVPLENSPSSRALRGETARDERLVLTSENGRSFTILASASPLYMDDCVSGAVAVWHDVTEHERLSALEERHRLARELHDSLSQALYGISLGAHTAQELLDADREKVLEALDYVISLANAGLAEMRALIFDLRPESLEAEGLVAALAKQAAALRARRCVDVAVDLCDEPLVPLEIKEAIYRIAIESMTNAVKHAKANTMGVRLCLRDHRLVLEVIDDGVGFDPDGTYPGHLGLQSMRERAARLGGSLEIESAPGLGCRIRAQFAAAPVPVFG